MQKMKTLHPADMNRGQSLSEGRVRITGDWPRLRNSHLVLLIAENLAEIMFGILIPVSKGATFCYLQLRIAESINIVFCSFEKGFAGYQ